MTKLQRIRPCLWFDTEAEEAARFQREHPTVPVATAAAQAADIHDLDGLRRIGDELC